MKWILTKVLHHATSAYSLTEDGDMPELPLCMKKSSRGNPILVDRDRFEYRMDQKHAGVQHWRCTNKTCNARIHTVDGDDYVILKKRNMHRCQQVFSSKGHYLSEMEFD